MRGCVTGVLGALLALVAMDFAMVMTAWLGTMAGWPESRIHIVGVVAAAVSVVVVMVIAILSANKGDDYDG